MEFYQYIGSGKQSGTMRLEDVLSWNIRSQVMTRNQEEKDLFEGYALVSGREIEVHVWEQWKAENGEIYSLTGVRRRLLPIVFFTWPICESQVRGR